MEKTKVLFDKYRDDALISRLIEYAKWTIPSAFPSQATHSDFKNAVLEYDFQSLGANLVATLATKMAGVLFPANVPFFRLQLNDKLQQLFDEHEVEDIAQYEKAACQRVFYNASYAQLVQALRLLIITGNALLHRHNESIRVYSLHNYVLRRSYTGEVHTIIIREHKFYHELEDAEKLLVGKRRDDDRLELYTKCERQEHGGWLVTQELEGKALATREEYHSDLCPYIPVCWNYVNGDAYGRGHVEDNAGDLAKLSSLSAALFDYEQNMLQLINLVDPTAIFDTDSAEDAVSGDFIQGQPDAVNAYEGGDYRKVSEIRTDLEVIETRLQRAFMYTGNTRDGERVTAYEISMNATEAEQVLGGVYSQLSQGMHLPLAYLLLNEEDAAIIHDITARNLQIIVMVGLQALSRASENKNLVVACSEMNAVIPAFKDLGLGKQWNADAIAVAILTSHGVDVSKLKYTEEEMAEIQQAEQAAASQQQQQAAMMGQQAGQLEGQADAVQALAASQSI